MKFFLIIWILSLTALQADKNFLITISTKDYVTATKYAEELSKKFSIKVDLAKEGRSHDGEYITIEDTNNYENLTKDYFIVVIASGENPSRILAKVRKVSKTAYIKKAKLKKTISASLESTQSRFLNADFTKVGNVVTDSKTGLVWQDDAVGSQMNWLEAIDYCEGLSLDSFSDWRLPNVDELKSIVDRSKSKPAIVDGFEHVGTNSLYRYWSSISHVGVGYEDVVWVVRFDGGPVTVNIKDDNDYVRCVRDGQ